MFISPQSDKLSRNGESSALFLLYLGVVVLQRWLQEHSTDCSMRLRRILECQLKTYRNLLEHGNISVDESTISKTLNKNGVHGRTSRKKPQLSKKSITACLKYSKRSPGCSTVLLAKYSVDRLKRNGPKFLLTVVQVWSTTTENVWLRLLLLKDGQPVIKSKGIHTFPTLTRCVQ